MDGARRRFIFAGNRFAPRMIGTVLEEKTKGWIVNQVNAYDPTTYQPVWKEKYSPDYYKNLEQEIGRLSAMAEYNNRPHTEGKIFTADQIIFLDHYPRLNQFRAIVGHWDVAYSGRNDYNAVRVWGLYNNDFYYIDGFVRQAKMEDAVRWMCNFQQSLPPTVRIRWQFESQFWNDAIIELIERIEKQLNCRLNIIKVDTPRTKKLERILRLQAYYQNKKIFYPAKKRNDPDLLEGLEQLYGIEPGYRGHDDAPDADEQAISWLENYLDRHRTPIITGSYIRNQKRRL
jgi:phage terminase large subunit-like protein